MKKYVFDMSGLSNPHEMMPEDIHTILWPKVYKVIEAGLIAVTPEIYEEMTHITGDLGQCIKASKSSIIMELEDDDWPWQEYVAHSKRINGHYRQWISEYNGGSPKTVCLNDMTNIALAKAVSLPVVSMESKLGEDAIKRRKIPNICAYEGVPHLDFNAFLRAEGITA